MTNLLKNGAKIIAHKPTEYAHLRVVLCETHKGEGREFVTWVQNLQDVERGYDGTYHGHYFVEYKSALRDFEARKA